MAEIKGGITVSGGSVDSMPVILDGRKSLYEEAIEQGLIDKDESYEQFINLLAVKPSELDKVVNPLLPKIWKRLSIRQLQQQSVCWI